MEKKKIWAKKTAGLHEYAKKHMSKHSSYQIDIGSEASERAFVTHRNAVTTAVKGTFKTIDFDEAKEKKC